MTRRDYPAGVTCWIDHDSPDPDAAAAFYGALLGWHVEVMTPPTAPASYAVATLDGDDAAGLAGPAPEAAWHTYVAVDDVDEAARRVVAAGGDVTDDPADAGPGGRAGRAASCTDPEGIGFRLWQARERIGVHAVNRPGAWNFSNLHTADPAGAAEFYGEVFGWRAVDQGFGVAIQVPGYGDHLAAGPDPGIHERQAAIGAPAGFADVIGSLVPTDGGPDDPARWDVVVVVADRDEATDRTRSLGGTVVRTTETGWTREAVVRDPLGARLTLSQFSPPGGS